MAIAHVQSKGVDSGSVSTANLAFTSNITAGSLVIMAARLGDASATVTGVTDTRTNSYARARLEHVINGGETVEVWYAMNSSAGANTVTPTLSGTHTLRWVILEYSGLATTAALDQVNSAEGISTTPNSGDVTTTVNDELLFCGSCVSGSQSFTAGTDYIERVEVVSKFSTEDRIVSATLTTSGSFTIGSDTWGCVLSTFKIAAGAPAAAILPMMMQHSG